MTNDVIARRLQLEAREMDTRPEQFYSARALRRAAETILSCKESIQDLWESRGDDYLQQLPGIGERIAERIAGYIRFEKTLDQLKRMTAAVPSRN
ncbi:hypothetical protein KIH39_21470 [Telmatocola sphagniphila]|jgi:DNA polymerase/3'-5' exonuclease PolX|uniref:Crossover junction endonuclease MUS81-like HHH domain-containing protein n=1 Tax=Telmatocola sphagniphila TaxID=1123043 RepID=A0A8E6EUG9_9BACT|nr:helix-hairpin-helix domain-containing protein [Telmatocola sphagniphila]QVL31390.1 hypothetical protein KIH39_21470 [Telmatocola sphagniphila]